MTASAIDYHDYYVQEFLGSWQSLTRFMFADDYQDFDFSGARAIMERPVYPKTSNMKSAHIKGYIDILIADVRVQSLEDEYWGRLDYAVEVKSHIKSITETMRQINTHRMYMGPMPYVLASPDNRFIDILDSQNVKYLEMEKYTFECDRPDVDSLWKI